MENSEKIALIDKYSPLNGSNRIEYVIEVVDNLIQKIFSDQLQQFNKHLNVFRRERYVRGTHKFSKRSLREKSKEILDKVNNELSLLKRPDIDRWISGTLDVDYIRMCDNEPDKRFVNLVIAKLLWDHSKKNHLHYIYKIYRKEWYKPPYWIEIKWECSNCKHQNLIRTEKRTSPNIFIDEFKCPGCEISLDHYREFHFDWEKPIPGKEVLEKALELKEEILNFEWPHESPVDLLDWDQQDQYVSYNRNKYKLPHNIRKFLSFYNEMPKSEDSRADFNLAVDECRVNLDVLEKFEIIKKSPIEIPFVEIAQKIIDEVKFITSHRWLKLFDGVIDPKRLYFIEVHRFFYDFQRKSEILFNKYYFNEGLAFKSYPKNKGEPRFIKSVFNSKTEKRYFSSLKRNLPQNQSVLINYPVNSVFDLTVQYLTKEFKDYELAYLRRAYFDFVIINEEGEVIKILELQLGLHHKKAEYNKRDLLKKKLCEIAGVQFQELF